MKIFHLPDLGEGLAEAEIREWYVKVGDVVTVDQLIVSMETAKAVVDVPSPYAGKITQLYGKDNDIIKTNAPLVGFESENIKQDEGSVVGKLETSENKWDDGDVVIGSAKTKVALPNKIMPAARVLAKEMNIDLSLVVPTGPQGLITVGDVKKLLSNKPHSVSSSAHTQTLHGVRRVMAQAMIQSSQEVVPVTIFEDADITEMAEKKDLTVALIKAIVAACKKEPALNAWFDGKTFERKLFDEVHLGLAVDSEEGLFVPVIKNAAKYSDNELRTKINGHKQAINERSISADEMQGLTITLSNFGMIAGRYATPIIVLPSVAIIACGRSRETSIVANGSIIVGKILPLSLTFDHRAVTGGEATRFMGEMIKHLKKKN
jgi:2-oxoisovalerate dehydrogenase E2 component (dihydrolipoyl transacylase)